MEVGAEIIGLEYNPVTQPERANHGAVFANPGTEFWEDYACCGT